jgi:hypothetical protein
MSLKNPVTRPGIDPGTVRLVAQRLNHYATPGTSWVGTSYKYNQTWETGQNMHVATSALVKLAGLAFHILLHCTTKTIKFHIIPHLMVSVQLPTSQCNFSPPALWKPRSSMPDPIQLSLKCALVIQNVRLLCSSRVSYRQPAGPSLLVCVGEAVHLEVPCV